MDDDSGAFVLLDRDATSRGADRCFAAITKSRPDVLVLFFAGHANEHGLRLRDRLYPYSHLKNRIAATGAPRSLVVLDACRTGHYAALFEKGTIVGGLGGLVSDRDWGGALLAASARPRVITATDRTRSTGQGAVLAMHGDLTGALLVAARQTHADVHVGHTSFLSDEAWYRAARGILAAHGVDQGARHVGDQSAFPIVRAEATAALGSANVLSARLLPGGHVIQVDLHAAGRRFVETRVCASVRSSLSGSVGEFAAVWTPEGRAWTESIPCDIHGRLDHHVHRAWGRYGFDLSAVVRVSDVHDRTLTQQVLAWNDVRYVA